MSYETPVLVTGNPSAQSIWDSVGSSLQKHDVGTVGALKDGRRYIYSCNRGSAIVAGAPLKMTQPVANDYGLTPSAVAVGQESIPFTFGGSTTLVANQLAGGFVNVLRTAGQGQLYRIIGHPALTAGTALTVKVEPIRVAITASSRIAIIQHPNNNVAITDAVTTAAAMAQKVVGVTTNAIPSGASDPQFFWAQTWGPCSALVSGTPAVGSMLTLGGAAAGTLVSAVEATTNTYRANLGYVMDLAVTTGDTATVYLTIS